MDKETVVVGVNVGTVAVASAWSRKLTLTFLLAGGERITRAQRVSGE